MSENNDVREFIEDLTTVVNEIKSMLIDKNRKYGNSALKPIRCFSKSDPIEQLNVRIDDKISRLQSGQADEDEDVELDLIGYLLIKRIAKHRKATLDKAFDDAYKIDKLRDMHTEMAQCQQEPKAAVVKMFTDKTALIPFTNLPSNPYSKDEIESEYNCHEPDVRTEEILRNAI